MTNMADFNMSNSENAVWEVCPHSEFCGGCIYQGVSYADQLAEKEKQVKELLEKKSVQPDKLDAIEGCPSQYGYRNKMEYTFGDFVKDGEISLGMHRKKNFMSIVTVDCCQLVDTDFNIILRAVLDFVKTKKTELHLNVYQKNMRAIRFYQREGFKILREGMDEATGEKDYEMTWRQE